jgi:N-acylglucosamine-6-phosphate 2-epimerase
MTKEDVLKHIKGGLIVSCQALEGEPLHGSEIMAKMALAAEMGGAVAIRANTVEDINTIHTTVKLPIIGLIKQNYADSDIYITPTLKEVQELIDSAAEIIAFDATLRKRPNDINVCELISMIKKAGKIAMADISTFEEGIAAVKNGVEIVSTTMSGYTPYTPQITEPDYELIHKLHLELDIPVFAEGRVVTPEQMIRCFENGAYCVVIGAAITRPQVITKTFVEAIERYKNHHG